MPISDTLLNNDSVSNGCSSSEVSFPKATANKFALQLSKVSAQKVNFEVLPGVTTVLEPKLEREGHAKKKITEELKEAAGLSTACTLTS